MLIHVNRTDVALAAQAVNRVGVPSRIDTHLSSLMIKHVLGDACHAKIEQADALKRFPGNRNTSRHQSVSRGLSDDLSGMNNQLSRTLPAQNVPVIPSLSAIYGFRLGSFPSLFACSLVTRD